MFQKVLVQGCRQWEGSRKPGSNPSLPDLVFKSIPWAIRLGDFYIAQHILEFSLNPSHLLGMGPR